MPRIVSRKLDEYATKHTTQLPKLLRALMDETERRFPDRAEMLCGPVEGELLRMLVAASGAKRVLEIGTFTGFSALCMASGLPGYGEVVTLEIDPEHAEFARSYFEQSEDGRKVRLILGPALESLKTLAAPFDFAFIDADKTGYPDYYEQLLARTRPGGLIAVDNVLAGGGVVDGGDAGDFSTESVEAIRRINDTIATDERVDVVMLAVADGLTLARKS